MIHKHYPSPRQVDAWCDQLCERADAAHFAAKLIQDIPEKPELGIRYIEGHGYVAFESPAFETFYGFWQPVTTGGPAPLLVQVPGYAGVITPVPTLVHAGFNVLHVNPLGYCTPHGFDESKRVGGYWPVLPETVLSLGRRGYVDWLLDVLVAVRWAAAQPTVLPERLGFFGTSQGGGGALLAASLLRDRGARAVAADLPFLTNYPMMADDCQSEAYQLFAKAVEQVCADHPDQAPAAWQALGYADTLSHAHRLTMPTLLTAGTADVTCPPATIQSLFDALPATKSYTELAGQTHGHTVPFLQLALAWFRTFL